MVKNSDSKLEYWIGFIPYFWIENEDVNFCRRIYILPEKFNDEFLVRLDDLSKSRYKNLEISKSISRIIYEEKDIEYDYSVEYLQLIGEASPANKEKVYQIEDCQDSYIFDDPDNSEYYLRDGKNIFIQGCKITDTPIRVNGANISYHEFNEYKKSINYNYIINRMDSFLLNTPFVNRDIKNIYDVFHKKIINKYLDIELFILPTIDNVMSYIDMTGVNKDMLEKYITYYVLNESIYTNKKIGFPGKYNINSLGLLYCSNDKYYVSPRLRKELIVNLKTYTYTSLFYIEEFIDQFNRSSYYLELCIFKKMNYGFIIISTGETKISEILKELKIIREINLNELDSKYFSKEKMNELGKMFQFYFLYALVRYDLEIESEDDITIYQRYLQDDYLTVREFNSFVDVFTKIYKLFL